MEQSVPLDEHLPEFEVYLERISRFHPLVPETRVLEVGCGSGWFTLLCRRKGLDCRGIDACAPVIEFARERARKNGLDADFQTASVEEDLGREEYDVIFAGSVFEHVRDWERGLTNVFRALRPDGVLYFYSTNRFSIRSGEHPLPFYSWLPSWIRFRLQARKWGEDILEYGVDFHHFTYGRLRRFFRRTGFHPVLDQFDIVTPDSLVHGSRWKRAVLRLARLPLMRTLALSFSSGTLFLCRKPRHAE